MKHGKQVLILETPVASSVGIVGRRLRFAWCVFQSERGPTDESGTERAKRPCGKRGNAAKANHPQNHHKNGLDFHHPL